MTDCPARARRVLARTALISVALVCSQARAFQLPTRFLEAAEAGGGGGRLFTGSPNDRYTCKVCHTEGIPPHLQIAGFPVDGYVPGQTYTIVVDWPDTLKSVALNFEFTNRAGQPFGQIAAPGSDHLTPGDLCSNGTGNLVAQPRAGERQFALVRECGAHQATAFWTAPVQGTNLQGMGIGTDAVFAGSLVSSDKDGTINGDSVTDFSRIIGLSGTSQPVATKVGAGCHTVQGQFRPSLSVPLALYGLAAALFVRWRRTSNSGTPHQGSRNVLHP